MAKALLLPASLGDGHKQVASALRNVFIEHGVEVIEVDCFRSTNFRMARCLEYSYEWMTRYTPPVYGMLYRMTSNLGPHSRLWKATSSFFKPAVIRALEQYHPDIVLQLFPDHSLARLIRQWNRPYIGVVLTDYSIHGSWFHDNVDTYFFAHEEICEIARPFVSAQAEVVISGIPIRSQFHIQDSPQNLSKNRPYILFATGGRGVFPHLRRAIVIARRVLPNHAVYVMCGRNEVMLHQVEGFAVNDPDIHGLPFVNNVSSWLRGASFAVIKPGGVTVSECLASHCPMVIYHPQPGQEANNAAFMKRIGAADIARNSEEFYTILKRMKSSSQRTEMAFACASVARPDAAKRIVEHALQRLKIR
jgi:processive 1,2-diacylglycerol beta-glucosyltransferase